MKTALKYLLMAFAFNVNAQTVVDSIHTLPEVEKVSTTIIRSKIIYTVTPSKNLNDLLKEQTGIYIKSYGNGQLTSLSYRGTGAAQNDLLWNGIKLNSPSLGQVDVSLFNLGLADELRLNTNSETGNVGASVNIVNQGEIDSAIRIEAHVTYGSFNTISTIAKAKFGNGKVTGTSRISYFHSDNDYTFNNTSKPGHPEWKLTNGKVSMLHFLQQFGVRVNPHNALYFNAWISDAQRQIPPIMSKDASRESQGDYSLRGMLAWKGNFKKVNTDFTSAILHDVIRYENPGINLDAKSVMQAVRNNFNFSFDSLKWFSLKLEAGYDFERAVVPNYSIVRQRHIVRLSATINYEPVNEILVQLKLRQHINYKTLSPFSPALFVRYKKAFCKHTLQFYLNASRNFRFATLNDLYWNVDMPIAGVEPDHGNPNLRTEKSWDGEIQAYYAYQYIFSFKASGFCKYITDLIQWQSYGSHWEPNNVKRVLSRGLEVSVQANVFSRSNFSLLAYTNYTYTRATSLDAVSVFDLSKGKQLIYVPLHLLKAGFKVQWKQLYLRPVFTYTSDVFITTDNSQGLPGYYLLDLELGKDFTVKEDYEIGLAFRVNNATGARYQNVAQRPMPGRNFEGTIRFNIRK